MHTKLTGPSIEVVCAGEAMAMLVPDSVAEIDQSTPFHATVGGAESNVAAFLAQLGITSAWVGRVGSDPFGGFVIRELTQYGVDTASTEVDPERPTGVAFKHRADRYTRVDYFRTNSAASAMDERTATAVVALAPQVIHLSGITSSLSAACAAFNRATIEKAPTNTMVSFDVNWRPKLWGDRDISEIKYCAQHSDVVFVGLDEAEAMWGVTTPAEVRKVLPEPSILVVKQGAEGATVITQQNELFVPALTVDVVEPVGAGDGFAAGFIAGVLQQLPLKQTARLATIVASSALSVKSDVGPVPPPSSRDTLVWADDDLWARHRFHTALPKRSTTVVSNC